MSILIFLWYVFKYVWREENRRFLKLCYISGISVAVNWHHGRISCVFEDSSSVRTSCHTLYTGSDGPLGGACGPSCAPADSFASWETLRILYTDIFVGPCGHWCDAAGLYDSWGTSRTSRTSSETRLQHTKLKLGLKLWRHHSEWQINIKKKQVFIDP